MENESITYQVETTQRGLRLPVTLDEWLIKRTCEKGFRSVPECIMDILREKKEVETQQQTQAA